VSDLGADTNAELARVREAQAGSAQAFSRLVRAHQQGLRLFLRRLCGNPADADDLAQETFVRAFALIARFDSTRNFRAWLFGIGWRKYREQKRGWLRLLQREGRFAEMQNLVTSPDPDLRLDLATALAGLPPEQRAALLLCLHQEFTHAEAAEALDMPLGTIKSHVLRGRERLEEMLKDG
jgi:RNA polymerase sigma factor (sigma-70 family)